MKTSVQNKISSLLEKTLDEKELKHLTSVSLPLSDSIQEQDNLLNFKTKFGYKDWQTSEGYILNMFGHISLNPSKKERSDILQKVYKYYSHSESNDDIKYVNYSEKDADNFIKQVIQVSKQEKSNFELNNKRNRDAFLICGERGIGKTIFINHLLTKYNNELDHQKVIWIRINLSDDFGGLEPDLENWINAKIAYVMFKYYYKNKFGDFDDLVSVVRHNLETNDEFLPEDRERYIDNLNKLVQSFHQGKASIALNANLIHDIVANEIRNYTIRKGYSFIYIIDNLDKIDSTERFKKKAAHLLRQLNIILNPDTRLGGAIILATRPETRNFLRTTPYPTLNRFDFLEYHIKEIPFEEIIYARIDYLRTEGVKYAKRNKWNIEKWDKDLDEFEDYLLLHNHNEKFNEFISHLDNFFGYNHRAKTQLLQLSYYNFKEEHNYRKRYRIIEAMVRGGYIYPPKLFTFSVSNKKMTIESQIKIFDNVFLPTIFNYPYVHSHKYSRLPHASNFILLGVRIIQLAKAYEKIESKKPIPIRTILSILEKIYNYDEDVVRLYLDQMSDSGIVRLINREFDKSKNWKNYSIQLLPKSFYLLSSNDYIWNTKYTADSNGNLAYKNHENIINEIAYLNLCALRLQINKEELKKDIPFIKAVRFDNDKKETFIEWVNWKIINSIAMARIFEATIFFENETSVGHINKLTSQEKTIFEKIDTLDADNFMAQVKHQLNLVINEMEIGRVANFEKLLDSYIKVHIN